MVFSSAFAGYMDPLVTRHSVDLAVGFAFAFSTLGLLLSFALSLSSFGLTVAKLRLFGFLLLSGFPVVSPSLFLRPVSPPSGPRTRARWANRLARALPPPEWLAEHPGVDWVWVLEKQLYGRQKAP